MKIYILFLSLIHGTVFADSVPKNLTNSTIFNYQDQKETFWEQHLTGITLAVCRMNDTEKSGSGKYDNFYEKGTYYCACCGGDFPLYSSTTKFDSKTGWPSFYAPLPGAIIERKDPSDKVRNVFGLARTEVICKRCHSHLGHVFDDGPEPTGKRYCMNSAALTFVKEGDKPINTFDLPEGAK